MKSRKRGCLRLRRARQAKTFLGSYGQAKNEQKTASETSKNSILTCVLSITQSKFQLTLFMTDFRPKGITIFAFLSAELINITI